MPTLVQIRRSDVDTGDVGYCVSCGNPCFSHTFIDVNDRRVSGYFCPDCKTWTTALHVEIEDNAAGLLKFPPGYFE